jgi:hypothetical protein
MKEIDEAYDYIILNRGSRSGGGGSRREVQITSIHQAFQTTLTLGKR